MNKLEHVLVEDIEFYENQAEGFYPNSEKWERAVHILEGVSLTLRKLGYGSIDEFKEKYKLKG